MNDQRRYRHRDMFATGPAAVFLFACGLAPAMTLADDEAFVRSADAEEIAWGACPDFMPDGCRLGVLQGDPSQPNADVLFRLEGDTTAPRHRHTSAERMVLISGELEVDYDGQDVVTLTPGDYAYGPPELPHSATCRSAEPCILFIAFEEPVDAFAVDGD
jgi:quercetin dioxygenase-like cupin family protein